MVRKFNIVFSANKACNLEHCGAWYMIRKELRACYIYMYLYECHYSLG